MQQLEAGCLDAVHACGREPGDKTAEQTDHRLGMARSQDPDVVVAVRSLDLGSPSENRSRVPLIRGLNDRFKLKSTAVAMRFQNVRTQIDSLLAPVQSMQGGLTGTGQVAELVHWTGPKHSPRP